MKLLRNTALQGYSATQSSQRGWKEINCFKDVNSGSSTINTVRLDISAGNPEFYFLVHWEWSIFATAFGDGTYFEGSQWGFRVQSNGTIDNPTGNGAVGGAAYFSNGWQGGMLGPTFTYATRQLTFTSRTSDKWVRMAHQLYIFSDRIDLITPVCI